MNTEIITGLAPFLRGCSFNGVKGSIVVSFTDRGLISRYKENKAVLNVTHPDHEKLEGEIAGLFTDFRKRNEGDPGAVIIGNEIGFALGIDFETASAVAAGGAEPRIGNIPPVGDVNSARNEVVQNKVAVVTGGAQGFGEGLVRELAAAGALVCIADLNVQGAEKLAVELNNKQGRTAAFAVQVNVADEDSVREMADSVVMKTGGIDLFISNAGVLKAGSVKEIPLKDFKFVTDVNYVGYFLGTKYVSPVMAAQNRGAVNATVAGYFSDIIQINSKSGLEGSNKNGAYAGGKFGGIGLTQSFAKELVTDNIKVNSICPGNFFDGPLWSDPDRGLFVQYLNTGKVPGAATIADVKRFYEAKVPMNRGCSVQDVAKAVYYVIDQQYETGQAIPVTGGQVMLN
jgi:sorbitol-6-phosphate 2-dehydrogenase